MIKDEVLKSAGYTEDELIVFALQLGVVKAIEWRAQAFNSESYEHYDNLLKAFRVILDERENRKEATK